MARADIPAGVVLSREGDAWIREDWVRGVALPVYVGKMIYVGNWAAAPAAHDGANGGAGRLDLAQSSLLDAGELRHAPYAGARVVFRDIARTTDRRSFVSALVPGWYPCGNKTPLLGSPPDVGAKLALNAVLTSLAFDWGVRQRMSGATLNWHIVESLALAPPETVPPELLRHYARLTLSDIHFAPDWLRFGTGVTTQTAARTPHERIRVAAMVDAAIAAIMGLSIADLRHILAECDLPNGAPPAHPKGFWRVDKDKPPEQRQTVLTLLAFDALHQHGNGDPQRGLTTFLARHADGWPLPETIRLADHGLAKTTAPSTTNPSPAHSAPASTTGNSPKPPTKPCANATSTPATCSGSWRTPACSARSSIHAARAPRIGCPKWRKGGQGTGLAKPRTTSLTFSSSTEIVVR